MKLGLFWLIALLPAGILPAAAGSAGAAPAPDAASGAVDFGSWWHDGRAELDGYRLSIVRYGQPRRGQAVAIYVTEPFSESKRVKVEDPERSPADVIDVLKLNLVRDFQTGIYDYNTMVSLFVRSPGFAPVKLSFSSAEWCGHVYQELLFGEGGIDQRTLSYFEDESTAGRMDSKPGGLVEDNLFVLLRGLEKDFLASGDRRSFDFLPSPFWSRLTHHPMAWTTADVERLPGLEEIQVPAGKYSTTVYVVRTGDHREGRFNVEREYPHRIVRWSWRASSVSDTTAWLGGADSGELTGSARLQYWKLHGNGDESYLRQLGLEPTVR